MLIPTIQVQSHLSQTGTEWIASGYIVSFAGFLLLVDFFGRRLVGADADMNEAWSLVGPSRFRLVSEARGNKSANVH